jgi:hypothetical protein
MISLEIGLVEDIIKIIGSAIHNKFSHDDVENVKNLLISKGREAVQDAQKKSELPKEGL